MVTEKDARSLAICYEAFCDARNRGNARSMRVWAHQLVIRQDATGIELVTRKRLVALYESIWGDPERGVAPVATAPADDAEFGMSDPVKMGLVD